MFVITIQQRYRRTDRRTDEQQYRATHVRASRGKNEETCLMGSVGNVYEEFDAVRRLVTTHVTRERRVKAVIAHV